MSATVDTATGVPAWLAAKAVAHPIRAAILHQLAAGERSPVALADRLGEPLGVVSYHFKVLHELGVIELVRTVPRRGAVEHFYRARWQVTIKVDEL